MAGEFNPEVGVQVLKSDAEQWRADYQKANPGETRSVFYGRIAIQEILKDTSVTGISFLFCRKKNSDNVDQNDLVLVGTKQDGTLVWKDNPPVKTGESGGSDAYDRGTTCPPYC